MNQELFHEMQRFYDRLETRSGQLFHALFHRVFELEVGWHGGHYHKNEDGTWIREAYPIPVIGVKGFCDIEVQPDHISVSTKLRRSRTDHRGAQRESPCLQRTGTWVFLHPPL